MKNFPRLLSAAFILAGAKAASAAPANDNFAAATPISAVSGTLAPVSNATATSEAGEPLHGGLNGGHSIWHRFTPAAKDRYVFNTNGSTFDTTMAAYTGSVVNALTELASDNDHGADFSDSLMEFTADPAKPVSIAVDGFQGATGFVILSWVRATLENNAFSSAKTLSGAQGVVGGWNFRATGEAGEPNSGASVWYTWTVPAASTGLFRLKSADMDSFIGVYTGSVVSALTLVTSGTAAAGASAQVSFNAVAGTVYRIQIKGSTGGTGEFTLSWGPNGGTGAPLLPDMISHASSPSFMYDWTLDQTEIPGRTLLRASTATANIGAGKLELRGSNANPAVYQRIFNLDGTWTDRFAGTFTFHPTHGHLHFDGWLQFYLRERPGGTGTGAIVAAGEKTSFSIFDLQAHDTTLPGAPAASVYTGGGLVQGISVGWRDVYTRDLPDQWIDVTSVPPGDYWLESMVDPDNRVLESDETNNVARIPITYTGSAPSNNAFTGATLLAGGTAATTGRNFSATKESGEPNHAGNAGGKSVWYRWVAPAAGPVTVSTAGSSFDTLLGIYTGTAVNGLTAVASNDDDGALTTSRVTFNAVSGTTYRIAVDGKGGAAGTIEIAINPASNDHFANAFTITGGSGTASGSNRGATAEALEEAHAGSAAVNSIWYFWHATLTGDAVFSTEGSSFNVRLAVYSGGPPMGLTPVASATGTGVNAQAAVTFHVNAGSGYYIAVDGGPGALNLAWESATAIAPFVISQPSGGNYQEGTDLPIAAHIGGSPVLTYQWKFGNNVISDGPEYSGTTTATLTVQNLAFADSGAYTLTAVNPGGTVTTHAANIIVLTNPRTASITDSPGDIGGSVFAPVMFNTTGNEHGLQFTLVYNPAILGNGRITAGAAAAGAAITLDRSQEVSGRLGVMLTLPGAGVFAAGLRHALDVQFDVSPSAATGMTTLGFGDTPVADRATAGDGSSLPVVFDPANITLSTVKAGLTVAAPGGGTVALTLRGLRGRSYQLLRSPDLTAWTAVQTGAVGPSGTFLFTVPAPGGGKAFYKAALVP